MTTPNFFSPPPPHTQPTTSLHTPHIVGHYHHHLTDCLAAPLVRARSRSMDISTFEATASGGGDEPQLKDVLLLVDDDLQVPVSHPPLYIQSSLADTLL